MLGWKKGWEGLAGDQLLERRWPPRRSRRLSPFVRGKLEQ